MFFTELLRFRIRSDPLCLLYFKDIFLRSCIGRKKKPKDEYIIVNDTHEAIVSKDVFEPYNK